MLSSCWWFGYEQVGVEADMLVPKPSVTPPDLLAMASNISNHRLHYAFPSSEPVAQLPQQATAGHHHLSPFRCQHRDETVCCAEIPIPLRGPQSCGMTTRYGGITRLVQTLEVQTLPFYRWVTACRSRLKDLLKNTQQEQIQL